MYLHKVVFNNVIGSNHGVNESSLHVDEIGTHDRNNGEAKILEKWFGYEVSVYLDQIDRNKASSIATRELYQYIDLKSK